MTIFSGGDNMIQKFEELSMNAFPAISTVLVNGWILRFSDGYAKRANSINVIYPCAIDVKENIKICEKIYKKNGLDIVFKLTDKDIEFDELLNSEGYIYVAKTNIMLKSIKEFELENTKGENIVIDRELKDKWFEAFTTMTKVEKRHIDTLRSMLSKIVPDAYFVSIVEDDKIIAVGLGVAERGYIGIYDVFVEKARRRCGLGTRLVNKLIAEAKISGCENTYLQVIDDNEPAKQLYDKLGYKKQYSYWYRVKKVNK